MYNEKFRLVGWSWRGKEYNNIRNEKFKHQKTTVRSTLFQVLINSSGRDAITSSADDGIKLAASAWDERIYTSDKQ